MGEERRVTFTYYGGACVVVEVLGYSLVFDPADFLSDDDIARLRGPVITLYTQSLDDHFHERAAMRLVEMKSSLIVGTSEVCRAVGSFVPSIKLVELQPRRGFRVGPLRVYAIEGRHEVPTNLYYVTWGPSILFAGDTGYVQLAKLKADLAFLPAGGSAFSSPESAHAIALDVGARYVVPVHCERGEALRLSEMLGSRATTIIPTPRRPETVTL